MTKPQQRAGLRVVGVSVCLFAVLVGCSGDDTYLPALEADPMASYEAEGLELIDAWEHAQRSSILGSAPRQAEVGRTYRIEDESQARSLLVDAVEFAKSEGWEMTQPLENKPDFNSGAKELAPGTGELSIALGAVDPGEPQGPRQLSIYIRFDPPPTD